MTFFTRPYSSTSGGSVMKNDVENAGVRWGIEYSSLAMFFSRVRQATIFVAEDRIHDFSGIVAMSQTDAVTNFVQEKGDRVLEVVHDVDVSLADLATARVIPELTQPYRVRSSVIVLVHFFSTNERDG